MPTRLLAISLLLASALVTACNRADVRIYGASFSFPDSPTDFRATFQTPHILAVPLPIDRRAEHYAEAVDGTKWTGCSTDPFLTPGDASKVIQEHLVKEIAATGLFRGVHPGLPAPGEWTLKSEIHAFCSQVVGFLFMRVAGISSIKFTLQDEGTLRLDQKFERVVTDADTEYTGWWLGTIEQAMKRTMADSLRELLRKFFLQLEASAH